MCSEGSKRSILNKFVAQNEHHSRTALYMCALHHLLLGAKQENRDMRNELKEMRQTADELALQRINLGNWDEVLEGQRAEWEQKKAGLWANV